MFPDDQEPLARTLAMQASKRNSRRQGAPQGGMPNILRPMDSLEAQDAMDSMQYEDPPSQSPFRLAIGDGNSAPIQTVQQRQSGARMDCSTGQCRLVQQPVQQAQPSQQRSTLAQQLGLPPGSTVTAIDGVPVGQGMGFPAPPPPASFQAMPSGGVVQNPPSVSSVTGSGRDYLDEVADTLGVFNPFMGAMARSAGTMSRGQVQDRMALEAPAHERADRRLGLEEELTREEIATQRGNRAAQREQTVAGLIAVVDDAIKGVGEHAGKDAMTRADLATYGMQAAYNAGASANSPPFDLEGTRSRNRGKTLAEDLANLLSDYRIGERYGPGGTNEFARGAAEYLDAQVSAAYVGRKDASGNFLIGAALNDAMVEELAEPFARRLTADALKRNPAADPKVVLNQQRDFSMRIIAAYTAEIDEANVQLQERMVNSRSGFNTALDWLATASRALQAGPPAQAYGVAPPQPTATGTTAPR